MILPKQIPFTGNANVRYASHCDKRRTDRIYYFCMCSACVTLIYMTKMIQIRNVPDDLHRRLKVRAAQEGMTLSDYLLSEVEQIAEKPTLRELMEKLSHDEPVEVDEPPEMTIRRMRDADDPRNLG